MTEGRYYVYVMTNWSEKVMYVGVTNDVVRRVYEHKNGKYDGFTRKYNVGKLVYFEECEDIEAAIRREKQIKGWSRSKKNRLVDMMNPGWRDLSVDGLG